MYIQTVLLLLLLFIVIILHYFVDRSLHTSFLVEVMGTGFTGFVLRTSEL